MPFLCVETDNSPYLGLFADVPVTPSSSMWFMCLVSEKIISSRFCLFDSSHIKWIIVLINTGLWLQFQLVSPSAPATPYPCQACKHVRWLIQYMYFNAKLKFLILSSLLICAGTYKAWRCRHWMDRCRHCSPCQKVQIRFDCKWFIKSQMPRTRTLQRRCSGHIPSWQQRNMHTKRVTHWYRGLHDAISF